MTREIRPTPRQHGIIETLAGRRPVCRAKYVSRCCDGPVDVYFGEVAMKPDGINWTQKITRYCALCGLECKGWYPPPNVDLPPQLRPQTTPEGT
jgi:hypothetical protein